MIEAYVAALQAFAKENPDICEPVEQATAQLRATIATLETKLVLGVQSEPAKIRQQLIAAGLQVCAQAVVQLHNHLLSAGMATYERQLQQSAKQRRKPTLTLAKD